MTVSVTLYSVAIAIVLATICLAIMAVLWFHYIRRPLASQPIAIPLKEYKSLIPGDRNIIACLLSLTNRTLSVCTTKERPIGVHRCVTQVKLFSPPELRSSTLLGTTVFHLEPEENANNLYHIHHLNGWFSGNEKGVNEDDKQSIHLFYLNIDSFKQTVRLTHPSPRYRFQIDKKTSEGGKIWSNIFNSRPTRPDLEIPLEFKSSYRIFAFIGP